MSVASKKVPIAFVTGIVCLGLGIAGGIVAANFLEKETKFDNSTADDGKGGDLKGGKGGKDGGDFFGPKFRLTALVTKLDLLTKKPLSVELTPDQKKQIQEQLAGLDAKDTLGNEEAQAKLDSLLKVVEGHRATLEAAGFPWPGGAFPKLPNNPLKEGAGHEHLKSLRTTLGK